MATISAAISEIVDLMEEEDVRELASTVLGTPAVMPQTLADCKTIILTASLPKPRDFLKRRKVSKEALSKYSQRHRLVVIGSWTKEQVAEGILRHWGLESSSTPASPAAVAGRPPNAAPDAAPRGVAADTGSAAPSSRAPRPPLAPAPVSAPPHTDSQHPPFGAHPAAPFSSASYPAAPFQSAPYLYPSAPSPLSQPPQQHPLPPSHRQSPAHSSPLWTMRNSRKLFGFLEDFLRFRNERHFEHLAVDCTFEVRIRREQATMLSNAGEVSKCVNSYLREDSIDFNSTCVNIIHVDAECIATCAGQLHHADGGGEENFELTIVHRFESSAWRAKRIRLRIG